MKIAIVGAGVVGVATAYVLAGDGHDVTVLEQHGAAAQEASFAGTGLLAPLLFNPLGLPCEHLTGVAPSVRLARGARLDDWLWRWRWARQGRKRSDAPGASESLAQYSQSLLDRWVARHGLDADVTQGRLVLLRSEREHQAVSAGLQALRDRGAVAQLLDASGARAIEPGLGTEVPLAGAIHLPHAQSANGRLLAQGLRREAEALGARFAFSTGVIRLTTAPTGLVLGQQAQHQDFDAIVLCAGAFCAPLLRPLGVRLPLTVLKGYTVTAPLRDTLHAPIASVVDLQQQIAITRLGQRVRIAGGAELGPTDSPHHAPTLLRLYRAAQDWFPGGVQLSSGVQVWRGARVLAPDGAPLLGATGIPGVWINAGHGAHGLALASGSARVLGDLLAQRTPDIPVDSLGLSRL